MLPLPGVVMIQIVPIKDFKLFVTYSTVIILPTWFMDMFLPTTVDTSNAPESSNKHKLSTPTKNIFLKSNTPIR